MIRWLHSLLFEGNINISRRTYIWNLASSITFSIQSAVFLLIVTRASGSDVAGVFILLFTVGQTLNAIGNYSLRDFQVSDIREQFSFPAYYTFRILTVLAMLLSAGVYALLRGLDFSSCFILFSLVGYRAVECIEDVSHGHVQRLGRFDVTSICMTIRIVLASAAFCIAAGLTGNPVVAAALLLITSILIYIPLISMLRREFPSLKPSWELKPVARLTWAGFPIFIGAFLYSYLINAPKYAIDALLSAGDQTIYNILFMPVFVINMLSLFIYKPLIVRMSHLWEESNIRGFAKEMIKQSAIILGLTGIVVFGGAIIGLKLLEIIYGVSLETCRGVFLRLLAFGGISAIAYYLNTLITILRKQYYIVFSYGFAFVINLLFTNRLIQNQGIAGAAWAYGLIVGAIFIFDLFVVCIEMYRKASSSRKENRL